MDPKNDLPPRPRRWWQHWFFKTFALSLVSILAFYVIERQVGEMAWRNYQRQAKARGVKLQLIDYQLAPIPDGENYAAAPVFQKLLAADDPIAETEKVLGLPAFPRGGTEVKPLDLTNRQKGFVSAGWIPAAGADPATDVLTAMERMEPVLAEIRLASSRPKTRWSVDWSKGATGTMPYYILQHVAPAFSLRARALLALDRPEEALSEIRHMIRADQSLASNPTLISGLVRIAIWQLVLGVCRDGIAANKWRDTDLQALAREAESVNFLAEWKFALESERGFGNQQFDQLITADRESFVKLLVNSMPMGTKVTALSKFVWLVAPRGWLRHNQVDYNKLYDMDLEDIDAEKERVSPQFSRARDFVDERSKSEFADWYYKIGAASAIITYTGSKRAFMLHSNLQQFRILCAAAKYRHAQGELPETLAQACAWIFAGDTSRHHGRGADEVSADRGGWLCLLVHWNQSDR
jgi:hypothetical protein